MRRKKILIALSSFLAVLLLFALLAPTLLSGYARDVVEREIGARVNGSVALKGIHLAWFSPQRVEDSPSTVVRAWARSMFRLRFRRDFLPWPAGAM